MKVKDLILKSNQYGTNKIVFGEDHADYLTTQKRVDKLRPDIVYHEFAEDDETKSWAHSKGYILKLLDLTYKQKHKLAKEVGENSEIFHRIREQHMKDIIDKADNTKLTVFIMGYDHALDKDSVIFQDHTLIKIAPNGRVYK